MSRLFSLFKGSKYNKEAQAYFQTCASVLKEY